jgi:hypothetical protein
MIAINPNGSNWNPTGISINTNTFANFQTNGIDSAKVMQRLWTVSHPGVLSSPVSVRLYYSPTELNAQVPSSVYNVRGWFKHAGGQNDIASDLSYRYLSDINAVELPVDLTGVDFGLDFVQFNNVSSFSTFGFTGNTSNSVVLPIELVHFEVKNIGNCNAKIDWATASEENVSHFEVQKQINNDWFTIGKIQAVGNSYQLNKYSYISNNQELGLMPVQLYRLKTVDMDGSIAYSKVLSLNCNEVIEKSNVQVFPNPVTNQLNIVSSSSIFNQLCLTNMYGKVLLEQRGSNQVHTLDLSHLAAGMYFLKIDEVIYKVIKK